MKLPTQLSISDLLERCVKLAPHWHLRLALTPAYGDTWLTRSLVIDVFPKNWLANPSSIFAESGYTPPSFLRKFPGQALFLADKVESQLVQDWFAHPESCELSRGSLVLRFRLPELLTKEASSWRLNSKHPDGYATLPWPHYDFSYTVKDATLFHQGDYDSLFAKGQGHFENLRDARAKLIHGESDVTYGSYQDQDEVEIRVEDGDGWIREVRKRGTRFNVTVGGLSLFPGYVILKHAGAKDEETECSGPGTVTFGVESDLAAHVPLDFVLTNDTGELDRARYVRAQSPVAGTTSAHVVVDDELEDPSTTASAGRPLPASTTTTNATEGPVKVEIHPISLFPLGPFIRNENLCFVLMPFADELRLVYDEAIVPAATRAGLECQRADEIMQPGGVMEQVRQSLMEARIVIADLTNMNPNVFYELGLAHVIGHCAILITQDKKWVPFDLQHMRWIKYKMDEHGLNLLRQALGRAFKAALGKTMASGPGV